MIRLDTERVRLQQELDALRARKNELSALLSGKNPQSRPVDSTAPLQRSSPEPSVLEEAKSVKEKIQSLEPEYEKIEAEFSALYKRIPNIATPDTPVGLTEEENVMVKQWGKIREFDFPIRNHAEIAEIRGWIDKERAANVAGSRFAYLK